MVIPIVIGVLGTVSKGLVLGLEEMENKRTSGDQPNYSIVEIGKNTKKSPGDLKRLAITQTLVENHQLTHVLKPSKELDDKIVVPLRNSNRNTKPARELRLEGLVKKLL